MRRDAGSSRRSFLARVAGGVAAGGALALVSGEARAFQVTDSDSGAKGDPAGRGRGRTGESDGDPTDPAGYGRPRTGCSDGDSGTNGDPAGRGRCRTGESDSDSGANADAAGHGRPRTGLSDGDSGAGADAAGRGRGCGRVQRPGSRPDAAIRRAAAGAVSGASRVYLVKNVPEWRKSAFFRMRKVFPAVLICYAIVRRGRRSASGEREEVADENDTQA